MANPHVEKVRGFFKKHADNAKEKINYYRTSPKMADWRPGSKKGNIRVAAIATGFVALLAVPFFFLAGGEPRPRGMKARGAAYQNRARPNRRAEAPVERTSAQAPQAVAPAAPEAAPAPAPVAKAKAKTEKKAATKKAVAKNAKPAKNAKVVKTAKAKKGSDRKPASVSKKTKTKKGKKKKS